MKCRRQRVVEITSTSSRNRNRNTIETGNRTAGNETSDNESNRAANRWEPAHRYITRVILAVGIAVSYALVSLAVPSAVPVTVPPRTNTASSSSSSLSFPETNPGMARNSEANTSAGAGAVADANRHRPVRFEAVPVPEKNYRDDVLKYVAVYADGSGNGSGSGNGDPGLVTVADGIRILRSSSEAWEASWSSSPSPPSSSSRDANASSDEPPMARALTEILRNAPHPAFRFETPAVSPGTVSRQNFEFVLVRDDYLAGFAETPNPRPFAGFLSGERCGGGGDDENENENGAAGCVFENLGGDATLVAPKDWSSSSSSSSSSLSKPSNESQRQQHQTQKQQSQQSVSSCYGHLANFVRGAPDAQIAKLWNLVAETLEEQLMGDGAADADAAMDRPLWWSTAGSGVAWLHFRLDSRPKYYHYRPYKAFAKPLGRDRLLGMDILLGDRKRNAGGNG